MKGRKCFMLFFAFWVMLSISPFLSPAAGTDEKEAEIPLTRIEEKVRKLMEEWDIPGLSLAIVKGDRVYTRGFGYADAGEKTPVTPDTLFELASTSKAFTALAVLKLEKEGLVNLDAPVSTYLPWFHVNYQGRECPVTLRQLLHHTSGIPTRSIALISRGNDPDALQQTVRKLVGFELVRKPGTEFEYATINYDVLGAIIESVSGMSYENYLAKNLLAPLGMTHTYVGRPADSSAMAKGYKIGFFAAREYEAPVYRGNNPAGYIISNANDMVRWLKVQTGLEESPFTPLVQESHKPDHTVAIQQATLGSYGMGWFSYMKGADVLDHQGLNPNYTAYIGFSPKEKLGVAVLANSSSTATPWIGYYILGVLRGQELASLNITGDAVDKGSAVVALMTGFFILCILAFYVSIPLDIMKGRRRFEGLGLKKVSRWVMTLFMFMPFFYGIYLLPSAMNGVNWDTALTFGPSSFQAAIILLVASMGLSWIGLIISGLFPQQNKYKRQAPLLLVLSVASGGANAIIIFLINASVFNTTGLFYQLYFFTLAFLLYIIGRKILQTELTKITFDIIYDLRMNLVGKIFNTSYQSFEKIDRGRVLATLNDDTNQISNAANIVVMFATSIITIIGSFIFLASIAFWATALTLLVVFFVAGVYYVVTQDTNALFEEARDTQNTFMGFLNGMLDGFKELSMHYHKRREYQADVAGSVDALRKKLGFALIKFINAFLIGESLLIITLGAVGFGFTRVFPEISRFTIMSFIMILLYLIGPFNVLLRSIPEIIRMRISWVRVQEFSKDVPANIDPSAIKPPEKLPNSIESIKAEGVMFEYKSENEIERFRVGPLDFEANKGEIVFIVGGNGSGKTTLAKLLTGLYIPEGGALRINGVEKANYEVGEYFSVVFSDYHLFEKLYSIDLTGKEADIQKYLKLLRLEQKVVLENNAFSTVDLSGGQRKRLALLQCYLEGHPIYLFDEIAADQDPEFRKFFYRDLLMRMKAEGKIVIAVTHDDHYFDVADRVIKMDMGQIETVSSDFRTTAAHA
ncbi:MAG: cyclic peptide export ABC transporter [Candidatus Aminicenantes bacterium]|nr:cyclic peptide export ABC transporter [Candidatus Aminicenantes bacterium]